MLGMRKLKTQTPPPVVDSAQEGEVRYLVSDKKYRARRVGSPLRLIGNLLIVFGVLLLLGIGGWYAYQQWSTEQEKAQLSEKFGDDTIVPPVEAPPRPTAIPVAALPTPLPLLNNTAVPLATQIVGVANTPAPHVIDTSPPVRLFIPSVHIDTKVVPVGWNMIPAPGGGVKSEWQVADYAVGHHEGSANPGQVGNVVLSGHVDYKGQVFKDLKDVDPGDEVIVYTEKGQYIYVVTDLKIVQEEGVSDKQRRENAKYMNPTPDLTLTMITCYPYGIDTHRLIVIAKPYQSALSTQSEFTIR
jgi:sortase A